MSTLPLERVTWALYSPFVGIRAAAEFSFAERQRKTGARYPKLRGHTYTTTRYSAPTEVLSINLETDDYLVLKHVDHKQGNVGKVVMSYPHLRRFIEGLQEVLEIVRNDCYVAVDGEYQLTEQGMTTNHTIYDMYAGAALGFEPVICTPYRSEEAQEDNAAPPQGAPGVRMYVNGPLAYSDVTLDEYATFVAFYERFDLFATSRAAVQITTIQLGGIPGVTTSKVSAPQPVRRTVGGLSK